MVSQNIHDSLPLITCYSLYIDLALCSLLLTCKVKFMQSWNTLFTIQICLFNRNILQLMLLSKVIFVTLRIYCKSVEIEFYLNQRLDEKRLQKVDFALGILQF